MRHYFGLVVFVLFSLGGFASAGGLNCELACASCKGVCDCTPISYRCWDYSKTDLAVDEGSGCNADSDDVCRDRAPGSVCQIDGHEGTCDIPPLTANLLGGCFCFAHGA